MQSSITRIAVILLGIVIAVAAIIYALNYFNIVSLPNIQKPLTAIPESTVNIITVTNIPSANQNISSSSFRLFRTDIKTTQNFKGEVKEKGTADLTLDGMGLSIKVIFKTPEKMPIRVINRAEMINNPDQYFKKTPEYIYLQDIKIGDNMEVIGKSDGGVFIPDFASVYR